MRYNARMLQKFTFVSALATCYLLLATFPARAHPLDVAYLDIGSTTSSELTLTVAVHPYQAFELVRGGSAARFDLDMLRKKGDLISAYVEDHVSVKQQEASNKQQGGTAIDCVWSPDPAYTPPSELDAVADGVTIAGLLSCNGDSPLTVYRSPLTVSATIFLDGFPNQMNIVRLELPDGYADRATLTRTVKSATVDISELFASRSPLTVNRSPSAPRRPDSAVIEIAKRALDPGVGIWGLLGLLLSATAIGALHALGPGHGKSLMAATLIGSRATAGRALALGTVMTVTHVSDVFLMAVLAGLISAVLPPTRLLALLEIVSAAGLVTLGLFNLWRAIVRYRLARQNPEAADLDEAHRRAHELGLPHDHEHAHEHGGHQHRSRLTAHGSSFRRSLWLGFVGSLAPCPTAWAVFMATLAAGNLGVGVLLLVAFSLGLYATILAIGMLLVSSTRFALRRTPARLTYALPILSACIIIALGAALLIRTV